MVIIAGAGPGDPDLITLKLQQRLQIADVILADRLVNPEIITRNVRPEALIISCGKQGFNENSTSQERINHEIISHALADKIVVRLKGGDVAIFSNVLDELYAIKKYNIPFEIIPGITAASGASAYTGIPLTARGYAQGVQCITLNPNSDFTTEQWDAFAKSLDTLVFYMSANNILHLSAQLRKHGSNSTKAVAIVEQATTIHQQVHISSLAEAEADFAGRKFSSPSLVIIGQVVGLHKEFSWYDPVSTGSVFDKLTKEVTTN